MYGFAKSDHDNIDAGEETAFKSGVLFVFDPEEWGRIQSIAFEPDSPALILSGK